MFDVSQRAGFRSPRAVLWVVWLIAALYLTSYANRDWISGDEGALGQIAERVLLGELPHRDFDAIYTGAQSFLHALAFRVFGIDLLVLRGLLLVFALAWFQPSTRSPAGRLLPGSPQE